MNNLCTCSTIVLLQDLMPLMSSKNIRRGTRLTQNYQKLMAWPWNKSNSPVEYCRPQIRVSKETTYISSPKDWRSSTISQPHGGWFSQEHRAEIKFLYQRVEAHSATKEQDAHIHTNDETPWYLHHVKIPNVNSVEPPLALQKQRRTVIPDATNDNHQLALFMKAQCSRVSIRCSDQPACQMPRACDYNISICASIRYKWKLSQKQG